MFRSSIFSSSTLNLREGARADYLKAAVCTLLLVGLAEVAARTALRPVGDYWKYWTPAAAAKFESYRDRVARNEVPDVVVIGDSTGARDLDPRVLQKVTGSTAFNLSWPANFPLALQACTLPLLRTGAVPRLVVASMSPGAFRDSPRIRRFEESILSSRYCRDLQGDYSLADYAYLPRLRAALPFRRSWWSGGHLPTVARLGFMPVTGGDAEAPGDESNLDSDTGEEFPLERFAVVEDLFRMAQARGFRVVVVLPPHSNPTPRTLAAEAVYIERLRAAGLSYLDYREPAFLSASDFFDGIHLNAEGARIYSEHLAAVLLRALHQEPHGL